MEESYSIASWYDRRSRSWVTQIKDSKDNQVGAAYYDGDKKGRNASIKAAEYLIEKGKVNE